MGAVPGVKRQMDPNKVRSEVRKRAQNYALCTILPGSWQLLESSRVGPIIQCVHIRTDRPVKQTNKVCLISVTSSEINPNADTHSIVLNN